MQRLAALCLALLLVACGSTPPRHTTQPAPQMNEVVLYAMSLADAPYQYGGESRSAGFDCSGLVQHVYRNAIGLRLPRTTAEQSRHGRPVAQENLLPGDLVFFNTQNRPHSHVGIFVGEGRFVHAPSTGKGVSISRMDERYWRQRFDGGRRLGSP